jgi:hypothetical protein
VVLVDLLWRRGGRKQNSESFECFHGVKFLIPFKVCKLQREADYFRSWVCVCVHSVGSSSSSASCCLLKKEASKFWVFRWAFIGDGWVKVSAITQFWMNHKWVFTLVTYPVLFPLTQSSVKGIKGLASPNV